MTLTNKNIPSPRVLTGAGLYAYSQVKAGAKQARKQGRLDMGGFFAGPVRTHDFMNKFMPVNRNMPKRFYNVKYDTVPSKREADMYEKLIAIITHHKIMPGYTAVDTSSRPDEERKRVDISWIFGEYMTDTIRQFLIQFQETIAEVKTRKLSEPFIVPGARGHANPGEGPMEHTSQEAMDTQGQLIVYASNMLARQHRTFIFTLLICEDTARFIHWDRGGSTVTESFNYVENPQILTEYLWRYGKLTRLQRGFDPTVRLADPSEAERFVSAIKHHQETSQRKLPAVNLELMEKYPASVITVTDGQDSREYVVKAPIRTPTSLVGRSTRVFYALDTETEKLVCLKDYWRPIDSDRPAEADIYKRLNEHKVPHLATVHISGDVPVSLDNPDGPFQETITDKWVDEYLLKHPELIVEKLAPGEKRAKSKKTEKKPGEASTQATGDKPKGTVVPEQPVQLCLMGDRRPYRHHRVVQELLYPLSTAVSSKELAAAIGNAIACLTKAHDDADVLHRDASAGNIMLRLNGEGVLNDWDHAIVLVKTGIDERTPASRRTGTWQYLSAGLANDPTKEHNILDDLESCYWVLLYQGIHYFRSTAELDALHMFDEHRPKRVLAFNRMDFVGGDQKEKHFNVTSMHDAYIRFDSQPFHHLRGRLTSVFRRYYQANVYEEKEDYEAFLELHTKYLNTLGRTMLEYINEALQSEAWPPSDAIPDRFPQSTDTQAEAYMNNIQRQSYCLQVSTTGTGGVPHKPPAFKLNGPAPSSSSRSTQKRVRQDEDEDVYGPGGTNGAKTRSKTNPSKRIKTMSPPKTPEQSSSDDDAPRPRRIASTMPPPPTRSRAQTSGGAASGSRQPIRRTTSATRTRFSSRIAAASSSGPYEESDDVIMAPPPPPSLPRATTSRSRTLSSPRAKRASAETRSRGSKPSTPKRTRSRDGSF
ncbi:hypothetical protein BXZ70DRAFT_217601 [Cristinia sonorae]|uniref:Fungal-type protein kinase domain-containing protein n=1 Tax=Cristinia sonorae TaxID=1940300 RepID=A0A8K0UP81_9AGAR|nr:hypothetical protein BXZ70DRAFT_217601 [Cristinia sonorae]